MNRLRSSDEELEARTKATIEIARLTHAAKCSASRRSFPNGL